MTSYYCINIKCKSIDQIKEAVYICLKKLKIYEKYNNANTIIQRLIGEKLSKELLDSKIYILSCDYLEYITIVAESHIITSQFAIKLSAMISDICIFSYFGDNMFEIYMYYKGRRILEIQKYENKYRCKVRKKLYKAISKFDEQKLNNLKNVLAENSVIESFYAMEEIFNSLMIISYNNMTDEYVESLRKDGEVYIINI